MIVFFEQEERPLKLNAVQMRIARASFEEDGKLLQPVLNQLGARTEEIALDAIAQRLGLPVVDLAKTTVPNDVLVNFPTKIIHRRNVFPLGVQSDVPLRRHKQSFRLVARRRSLRRDRPADHSRRRVP